MLVLLNIIKMGLGNIVKRTWSKMTGNGTDTDKQRIEELEARERNLRYTFNSLDTPLAVVDRDSSYLFANDQYLSLFGISAEEGVEGKKYADLHTEEETRDFSVALENVFQNGEKAESESYHQFTDKTRNLYLTLAPIKDDQGNIIAAIVNEKLGKLIPMCMFCKDVRYDNGEWKPIAKFLQDYSQIGVSHGICEPCYKKEYGDIEDISGADDTQV